MSPLRARQALGIGAGCAIIAQHPSVGTAATQRVAALGLVLTAAALLSAGTLTGRLALRAAPGTPVLALMAYAGWAAASLAWGSPLSTNSTASASISACSCRKKDWRRISSS